MELLAIFMTAFVVGLSGAMMPGPLLTVTIGESARRGFSAGPLVVLGHALLELVLIFALVSGLSVIITLTSVTRTIAICGGAFLIYMSYGMVKDARTGRVMPELKGQGEKGQTAASDKQATGGIRRIARLHPVTAGLLTSISNPYWSLWWATIGLSYITVSLKSGFTGLASFFTGHILADFTWYSLIAAAVAGGRKFLSEKVYRGILIICGIFLVSLGGYFLYLGLTSKG
ncbi:MAG: LysE type translocator [Firmicutes bacterium ADurb.Bin456]|nr:MAG: LysE type translocator [Firmicutes bacterium ADurb.Bin456]